MAFAISCNDKGQDCVGTDSYFPFDGRWSHNTRIIKAKEHYSKLINKPYGFRIFYGSILSPIVCSKIIKI